MKNGKPMQSKESEIRPFTIIAFTENKIGLINRVTIIFTRRHLNIDSFTASETEVEGVYRFTIIVRTNREQAEKVSKQIEKQIEILKADLYEDEEVTFQEVALYKMPTLALTSSNVIENLVRKHYARILSVNSSFLVIEKTGLKSETQALLEDLKPFDILEFVRSGRICVSKGSRTLSHHLEETVTANQTN